MDFSSDSPSHALLQLHKWDSSQAQLNLREFREAFISPSRERLLLLSYHREAALISLGESLDSKDHDTSDDYSSTLASIDKVSDNNPSLGTSFSESSSYPFLSDVCSLAWGISGDSYDHPEETSFSEFLFVSDNDSVIVHAFRESRTSNETENHTAGGDVGKGKWVEWGPSTDSTRDFSTVEDTNREGEGLNGLSERGSHDQKKWLRTFLTDVETVKLDDNFSTIFPKRSAFPSSAMVVSFNILGSTSSLLDLLIHTNTELEKDEGCDDSVPNQQNSAILKRGSISFKCFKLFSSSSHNLIGIALNLMEGVPLDLGGAHEEVCREIFLLVGKMVTCGIQWVSSVKLKDSPTQGLAADWTDFGFSDNLLVCLHATGNISFYGATTGEFLANMNILATCGLHHQLTPKDKEYFPREDHVACRTVDIQNDHGSAVSNKSSISRAFRRLLTASHSSVMGVIDENGVVYAISAGDHIPNKSQSFNKKNPQFQHSELGILLGWEIGAADISRPYMCNDEPRVTQKSYSYNKVVQWESYMSGFFTASQEMGRRFSINEVSPSSMRKVFLPTEKTSEDDAVCFSPFGVTRLLRKRKEGQRGLKVVHSHFYIGSEVGGERCHDSVGWEAFAGDAIGCISQGSCYLVTEGGLSVVLPSVSVSANSLPVDGFGYLQSNISMPGNPQCGSLFGVEALMKPWPPWKIEVLDRVLIYEGPEVADLLCIENVYSFLALKYSEEAESDISSYGLMASLLPFRGWGLEISRLRRLQLALDYLKFDEIEISLEMLVNVSLAEEGVMRLLFVAVQIISHNVVSDSEISATTRLLGVSTCFATKMIRKYGLMLQMQDAFISQGGRVAGDSSLVPVPVDEVHDNYMRKLQRMAQLLEITRNLECRLSTKLKRPNQGWDEVGALSLIDQNALQDTDELSAPPGVLSDTSYQRGISFGPSGEDKNRTENFALTPVELLNPTAHSDSTTGVAILLTDANASGRKFFPSENPKDMMARWATDNLDLKTIVKDALLSGRLPLAVLQLHLHRTRDLVIDEEPNDTFSEVRDVGKAIAYDLFLEGETELAVETLHKLGEDVETSLRQLAFGTVRKDLRIQIAEEMRKHGYLGEYDWKMLETIALIERVYPCCSFWKTFHVKQNELAGSSNTDTEEVTLSVPHLFFFKDLIFECGEIDGVVLGSWANINRSPYFPVPDEDCVHSAYWAVAAIWLDAWNQRTIERIMLDRNILMDVDVLWESRLEYHMCHNDWVEVSKLLDMIPPSLISCGDVQIALDAPQSVSPRCSNESPDYLNSVYGLEDLDAVCMDISNVRVFISSATNMCSVWLKTLMEHQLATKFIFMKTYWEGTAEMIPLLGRSGFISGISQTRCLDESGEASSEVKLVNINGSSCLATMLALHKVVMHHLVVYNLPNFLDVYLDHHKLALDKAALSEMQESTRDSQWAKWLLFSRVKGMEYDSSFSNARSVASHNLVHGNNMSLLEIDDIIRTVDDIAEDGEFAALATLMYAPVPIQDCLSSGSVNRLSSSSVQCTLENLRSALEHFPTLWHTLVAACFGQDAPCNMMDARIKGLSVNSELSDYLSWRDSIFFSTGYDTSLLQMLPCWFPKAVRRLVHLYVQGPLGWQSLSGLSTGEFPIRYTDIFDQHAEISAMSWEAAIEKHVQEELYTSSVEESGLGVEHHLHRGRALAAFKHLLSIRVQKLKLDNTQRGQSGSSAHGQSHSQTDVQALLAPITQLEESLLSSVVPLAIMHFEDSVLVASCGFLLELCGLSSSMLKVDVAALRRISSFYKSNGYADHYRQLSPTGSTVHSVSREGEITDSLARALADEYLHINPGLLNKTRNLKGSRQPSRVLMLVLQHLEKSSLPVLSDGKTCGSWLLTGNGDGYELRSRQKIASDRWNLVTVFCQMHQIPLSINYLTVLARDNDWVGFLSEAQLGGYPFERIVHVALKEFSDPRLRTHLLTVLKGMQSRKKVISSSHSDTIDKRSETSFVDQSTFIPVELFGILADCEKQRSPGKSLLFKAKDMCWPLLAMIASCFSDVSPLSCLTVWLEITAARETSSIKVNDVASQIACNVAAAIEATNCLPASAREVAFHYNRTNAKRRRLIEPISVDAGASTVNDVSVSSRSNIYVGLSNATDDLNKRKGSEQVEVSIDPDEVTVSLSKMVAVLCEQHLFLPLLRAFEIFLPSCSLLPFIRALQAFSQMRLSEASAHLGSFSARIREEPVHFQTAISKEQIGTAWISSTAVKAADAVLLTCPSPYEKRCLLQLLSATDFADGGFVATYYRQLHWKINLAEPPLRTDDSLHLGNETLDDASLLTALKDNGHWEQARNWARQLEANAGPWKSAGHQVTETQAESMVAEWKEFLWDVPEERVALWGHCQTLFVRYSFPALQAGLFFLKHAEAVDKDLPSTELHEMLLLSLQWLSGMITQSNPVYPLHLLREIETRVWLLAVESEAQLKSEGEFSLASSGKEMGTGKSSNIIDRTAGIINKMDNHINQMRIKVSERNDVKENTHSKGSLAIDASFSTSLGGSVKSKRRSKGFVPSRRLLVDSIERNSDSEGTFLPGNIRNDSHIQDDNFRVEASLSRWEERVGIEELERAVLSLLEFGQITAAKQLQNKLSPGQIPTEFVLIDAALKLAAVSTPNKELSVTVLDEEVRSVIQANNIMPNSRVVQPLQALENLTTSFMDGSGRGLCKRIIAVVKAANMLGLSFWEAFDKQPIELLQLLSLKAQDSFEEAYLLVKTHSMPATSIAQVLAESFLKGLLAAHRGGYMDSQKEEGPAPLLWRFSDFLKWAELCPSEPEIGHALMRLVITGQEIPHACEVELLILSHHFYKLSACLDGVDVLVALAATRVETYVSEGDFSCLARLITGVGNFHALNFILGILIENGQLDLLLRKFSAAADTSTGTAEAVRGFRMAVLTTLKQFSSSDMDALAMVYNHFDMKHETASLLESRAEQSSYLWFLRYDRDQNEDLLDAMRYYIEAAEVHSSIDAGNKTHAACARASLVSLQIRMPDFQWLNLSETNARRALVEQSRFQEALIVADAYGLNQPSEWALVIWNQMLKPELTEQFMAEFVAVLPLHPSMLADLARFYRAEVAARGDQSQFSVWLTGGGLPAEWLKYLGRSFRCLLKRTRDLRLRVQLATVATGFVDVIDACSKALDKVPDNAGPLVLRKGHGGAYLPLM